MYCSNSYSLHLNVFNSDMTVSTSTLKYLINSCFMSFQVTYCYREVTAAPAFTPDIIEGNIDRYLVSGTPIALASASNRAR